MATHDRSIVDRMSKRVVEISSGQIIRDEKGSLSAGLRVMLTEAISGLNLQAKIVELPVRTTYREMQHFVKSTYLRLAIQEVDVGGFLWLDSDLLPNWNWDFPDLPIPTEGRIAVVSEMSMGRHSSRGYFSAGVSVFPPGHEDYSSSLERLISSEVGPWLWGGPGRPKRSLFWAA